MFRDEICPHFPFGVRCVVVSFGFLKLTFRVAQIPNCSNDLRILILLESVGVVLDENFRAGSVGTALLADSALPSQLS